MSTVELPAGASPASVPKAADPAAYTETQVERRWTLKRNCSTAPGQFLAGMGLAAGLALAVGCCFVLLGFWPVMLYCTAEIGLIAAATLAFARHARDGETVVLLDDGRLVVDVQDGLATTRHVFNRNWTRLVRQEAGTGTLWLHYGAVRLQVARHVPVARRRRIETELRRALHWHGRSRHPA